MITDYERWVNYPDDPEGSCVRDENGSRVCLFLGRDSCLQDGPLIEDAPELLLVVSDLLSLHEGERRVREDGEPVSNADILDHARCLLAKHEERERRIRGNGEEDEG